MKMHERTPPHTVWVFNVRNFEVAELKYYHVADSYQPYFDALVPMTGEFYSVCEVIDGHAVGYAKLDYAGSGECYILGDEEDETWRNKDGIDIKVCPWNVTIARWSNLWKVIALGDDDIRHWLYGDDAEPF